MSLTLSTSISNSLLRRLPALAQTLRQDLPLAASFGTAPGDPLNADDRTSKPQQRAHDTDEATKDSIRHAAEGEFGEAVKDVGKMAENAAKGAKESAKLMYDSVKEKTTGQGASQSVKDDLKHGH